MINKLGKENSWVANGLQTEKRKKVSVKIPPNLNTTFGKKPKKIGYSNGSTPHRKTKY